jgi:hypothetical protein
VPVRRHRLTVIPSADGVITADDFVREGAQLTTFVTDLNDLYPVEHRFDVTERVVLGGRLGVQLELDRTPTTGSFGSAFAQFRLDVVVCNVAALPDGQPGEPGDVK